MGAVLLLVLLPIVAVLGFMLKTIAGGTSGGALLAAVVLLFLSCVIVIGALHMARGWDADEHGA